MRDFSAQVDDWVRASSERLNAVFRESVQRTVAIAQSNVPVDTGFLRASVRMSKSSMPPLRERRGDRKRKWDRAEANVTLTLAGAKVGDTLFVGYTAHYAVFVEYGTSRMAAQPFVGPAVQQWDKTVASVVEELKQRSAVTRAFT